MQPDTIVQNLNIVRQRIREAAMRCKRSPDDIQLVAVTKTQSVGVVRMAVQGGATILGENYVQESREKYDALANLQTQWHFIGHLQRNKAKYVVRIFDLIHSVDSEKVALELDKHAQKNGKIQDILIQVNLGGETTKSGISEDSALALVQNISNLSHIRIKGLMTLPPYFDQPERARPFFIGLRRLKERIENAHIPKVEMTELSMGMTGDFETAIEEGATLVRIGTAIFGARQ